MSDARTPRQESPELGASRKRVGKACDRCRLKKSKCDGSLPCQRCLADDQICVFSERKRSKDKTYPKGYVELLESRNQVLAEAFQKVLYCHQHDIDTSSLYPHDGKIVLNEVLGRLEHFKGLPTSFKPATYIDEVLDTFEEGHCGGERSRHRQGSECSTTPSSRTSLDLSREKSGSSSPTTPPNIMSPEFSYEGQYLSQMPKQPFFVAGAGIPLSISPSLLMPEYSYPQTILPSSFDSTFAVAPDSLMMDADWL